MYKGRLHSIETLGALDGPGLRTVFFLQGCNMKCVYCHNRDSWNLKGGDEITLESLIATAASYKEYYGNDGGVTFSGGEPLVQSDFLIKAVKQLKKMNIHTALDTSGSLFNEKTRELFQMVDLIILDIKHSRKDEYRRICSWEGEHAFSNLKYLQESKKNYWIRQVIVAGLTDTTEQIEKLAAILQSGNTPEKVELLPYHDMGREKWFDYGDDYPVEGMKPPSTEKMTHLRAIIEGAVK